MRILFVTVWLHVTATAVSAGVKAQWPWIFLFSSSDTLTGWDEHSAAGLGSSVCKPSASCSTDPFGQVLDNTSLHQFEQELLLFRYVMSPRLWGRQTEQKWGWFHPQSAVCSTTVWSPFSLLNLLTHGIELLRNSMSMVTLYNGCWINIWMINYDDF